MSKWEKAKFNLANMPCDGCQFGYCPSDCDLRGCPFGEIVGIALDALDIAERVENTKYINKYETLHKMWQRLYELEDNLEKDHGLDLIERYNVQAGFEAGLKAVVGMPTALVDVRGEEE